MSCPLHSDHGASAGSRHRLAGIVAYSSSNEDFEFEEDIVVRIFLAMASCVSPQ